MDVLVVAEHHRFGAVAVGGMAEEVEDAFLFHQARDEIEDGLVVLRAVGALGMLVLAADLVVLELEFAEQGLDDLGRSEEHTSELQSLMRISYAVFCLKKK